jgi:hypothetical protein
MTNPWKIATLGITLVAVTALSTGLTTAYVMRESSDQPTVAAAPAPVAAAPAPAPKHVVARTAAVATPVAVTRPAVVRSAPPAAPVAVAADCATGTQRAMKIAKPGLIGTLAGAGLGAIGGVIADGGSGAGKGALIGGLTGLAAGGGYGAYKTQQECGTIFGNARLAGS